MADNHRCPFLDVFISCKIYLPILFRGHGAIPNIKEGAQSKSCISVGNKLFWHKSSLFGFLFVLATFFGMFGHTR